MDVHPSVSPDDFMNFDIGPFGTAASSSDASGAQGHDSNNGGPSNNVLHHHQQQHQSTYNQNSDSMRVDLDSVHHRHNSQSPFRSSSTNDSSMDPATSMGDAFSALLSMHNVDIDANMNNSSASSSTSINNHSLQSLHTLSMPPSQQSSLSMTQHQQYQQQLPPFSQLHHSVQQHSHGGSPNSGSGPGTPLVHGSDGQPILNMEQQMRLTQLQQLQQLQNQLFQQQMAVQMELMSSGGLPSPNSTPLMSDLQNRSMSTSNNGAGSRDGNHTVGDHVEQSLRNPAPTMYGDYNNSFHGLPTPISSTEIRAQVDPNAFVSPMILHGLSTSGANVSESHDNSNQASSSHRMGGSGVGALGPSTPIEPSMGMSDFSPPLHPSESHSHHHHTHSFSHSQTHSHIQQQGGYHDPYQSTYDEHQNHQSQTNSRYVPGSASAPADIAFSSAIDHGGISSPTGDLEFDLPLLNSPWLEAYTHPNNASGTSSMHMNVSNAGASVDQQGSAAGESSSLRSTSVSAGSTSVPIRATPASSYTSTEVARSKSNRPGKRSASMSRDDTSPSSSNCTIDSNADDSVSRKTRQSPAIRPTIGSLSTTTISNRDYAGPKSAGVVSDRGVGSRGGTVSLTSTPAFRSTSARGRARKGSVATNAASSATNTNTGAGPATTVTMNMTATGDSFVSGGIAVAIGEVPGDSPSPVDLSMPPPAPPSSSGSSNSSTINAEKSSSIVTASSPTNSSTNITPVTPASIMNLGKLGLASGFGTASGAAPSPSLTGSMAGPARPGQCPKPKAPKPKSTASAMSGGTSGNQPIAPKRNIPYAPPYTNATGGSLPQKSPSLKPILPGGVPPASAAQLAQFPNYTHHLSGASHSSSLLLTPTSGSSLPTPTLQVRKTSHKAAEQKRRDSLKISFDELRRLLPPIPLPSEEGYEAFAKTSEQLPGSMPPRGPPRGEGGPNRAVSKLQLLRCGNDFIRQLKGRIERRDEYIGQLTREIRLLRNILCEGMSQASGYDDSSTAGQEGMHIDESGGGNNDMFGMNSAGFNELRRRCEVEGFEMSDLEINLDAIEVGAPRLGYSDSLMEQDEMDDDGGE